jgi:dolichyl-phosphate beta-glucosyltransferase
MSDRVNISIVIPAYNEATRLPLYLDQLVSYCTSSRWVYEIIVVDDGSSDNTSDVAASYASRFAHLHVIRLEENRGKGYAVKKGLLQSAGELRVFLDADGSVHPEEMEKNLHYLLEEGYDLFIGSRVLKGEGAVLKVKWYRRFIGMVFNFLVHTLLFKGIEDTQCGFKIFKKEVVGPLFSRCYLERFGFDIEILYLAHKMGYRIKEGSVSWHHVGGSKINLVTDSIRMFFNILQVRNWHCTPINVYGKHLGPDEYRFMYEMENYHWWFVSRRNLVVHLIKALRFSSPAILDVGSGTGGNLLELSKLGQTFGVDIAQQAVEFCRKRGLSNVVQSPVEHITYGDKSFDIITCLDLLEHVSNPVQVLAALRRLLKDGGRMVITVPAFRVLWSQHDDALCHLRRYEKDSLLRDLNEAGWNVETMNYFFLASFLVVAPIRIMRRLLFSRYRLMSDTTTLPPKPINEFLKLVCKAEIKLADRCQVPFGTTLYAIVSP